MKTYIIVADIEFFDRNDFNFICGSTVKSEGEIYAKLYDILGSRSQENLEVLSLDDFIEDCNDEAINISSSWLSCVNVEG